MRSTRLIGIAGVVAISGLCASAQGSVFTLEDGNSSVQVDPGSPNGMYSWLIDGVSHLSRQWFWVRIGGAGFESPLNSLTLTGALAFDGNTFDDPRSESLATQYSSGQLVVDVSYQLKGGTPGSGTADLIELITLRNTGSTPLTLSFLQYANFDLGGTAGDDTVVVLGPDFDTVDVTDPFFTLSETISNPGPDQWAVGDAATLLAALNDASVTNLGAIAGPLGPGDVAWAFQWDVTLPAGGSFTISKDKLVVPSAPAAVLFAVAGLATGRRRRA